MRFLFPIDLLLLVKIIVFSHDSREMQKASRMTLFPIFNIKFKIHPFEELELKKIYRKDYHIFSPRYSILTRIS